MLSWEGSDRRSGIVRIWTTVGIVSSAVIVCVVGVVLVLCFFLTRPMAHLLVSLAGYVCIRLRVRVVLRLRTGSWSS